MAQAQSHCVELFKVETSQAPRLLDEDAHGLEAFEFFISRLHLAPSVRRANEAIDSLMAQANVLIDHVVLNILSVHSGRLSPEENTVTLESSEIIVNHISARLQIPIQTLERAVALRINDQMRLDQIQQQADQDRSTTIGFGERAVATEDSPTKFQIGFETVRRTSEPTTETTEATEKISMGFDLGHSREPSVPQEIVRKKRRTLAKATETHPIGFKHFPGKDLEHSIYLSHETGYFVIRFEHQHPLGFLLRPKE